MRSVRYINKYLRIGDCNFEVIKIINNKIIVKFNERYFGYYEIRGNEILRKIPKIVYGDGPYGYRTTNEYWFFNLKPKEKGYALKIVENGSKVSFRVDTDYSIDI